MIDLFWRANKRLKTAQDAAKSPPIRDAADTDQPDAAEEFLQSVGYLDRHPISGSLQATASDPTVAANRLALLALAAKLERIFPLPCRQAPRARLLGAEIAPAQFGLKTPDQAVMGVGGRGLTWRSAFEGCIGEAAEYLSFLAWGNEVILVASARAVGAVSAEMLGWETDWMYRNIGLDPQDLDREIGWMTARRLDGLATLAFPADLCIRRVTTPELPLPFKAESSGCPAAPTIEDAQFRGLMELIERDAVALWWYGGNLAKILTLNASDSRTLDGMMNQLRTSKSRQHWFLDITSDIGIPTVAALSCDQNGGSVVGGFAADLDPLSAASSAALEMCQMEMALDLVHLKIEQDGQEALNEMDRRHLQRKRCLRLDLYPCLLPNDAQDSSARQPLPLVGSRIHTVTDTLARAGLEAYWIDLTRPEIGIPVVRILIPGLQSASTNRLSKRLEKVLTDNGKLSANLKDLPTII